MLVTPYALVTPDDLKNQTLVPVLSRKEAHTALRASEAAKEDLESTSVYRLLAEPSFDQDFSAFVKTRTSTLFEELGLPRDIKGAFTTAVLESYNAIRQFDPKNVGTLGGLAALAASRLVSVRNIITIGVVFKTAQFTYANRDTLKTYFSDLAKGGKGDAVRDADETIRVNPAWLGLERNAELVGTGKSVLALWAQGKSEAPATPRPTAG